MRVCGQCGEPGHNIRTCNRSGTKSTATVIEKSSGRRCGICEQVGHNARTCKAGQKEQSGARDERPTGRTCGLCRMAGHNARTCPGASKKASAPPIPSKSVEVHVEPGNLTRAEPVLPWMVSEGAHYWSSFGDLRWSAVRILNKGRSRAGAERLDPKSGAVVHRKARVRLDELVKRDPSLHGADKPDSTPAELFSTIRQARSPQDSEDDAEEANDDVLVEGRYETMDPDEYEKLLERIWVKAMMNSGDSREAALADWNRDWGW